MRDPEIHHKGRHIFAEQEVNCRSRLIESTREIELAKFLSER